MKGEPTSHCHDILTELREGKGGERGRNMLRWAEVVLAPLAAPLPWIAIKEGKGGWPFVDLKQLLDFIYI